jgi:hypothetical protein
VWAVPGALEQIIDNLLANALRVAPAGSTVTLKRRTVPGSRRTGTDPSIELHVIDQGPGMSATDRGRAFDRFWRAPDAGNDGSGLGLTIVSYAPAVATSACTPPPAPASTPPSASPPPRGRQNADRPTAPALVPHSGRARCRRTRPTRSRRRGIRVAVAH